MNCHIDMVSIVKKIIRPLQAGLSSKGNVFVYLVLVLLIFGVLGVTILSIFSLASQSASKPNYHRRLNYFRESAIRYTLSEMKNSDFDPDVIAAINTLSETDDEGYEIGQFGRFRINVFSPWFDADESKDLVSGGTIDIRLPEGKLEDDWVARDPNDLWLINYDYFDPNLTTARDNIVSWAKKSGDTTDTILTVTLGNDFSANSGERICFAAKPTETRTISDGGDLYIQEEARHFFPEKHGAININRIDYVYERLIHDSANNRVILEGVSASTMPNRLPAFPLEVDNTYSGSLFTGDFIILSPRNHIVIPTVSWNETDNTHDMQGKIDTAINVPNLATIQPLTRKPDIDFNEEDLTQALTQIETPDFITEDNTNKTIDIGSGVSGKSFGAAWYDEDKGIGAQNSICETGSCSFGLGIRVFFTLDYSGTADGLTFAIINSARNTFNSIGGDINMGELLAYGGDSRTVSDPNDLSQFLDNAGDGIQPPKLAVEFDTYTDNATLEYCSGPNPSDQVFENRNDPFENNRDAVQFVFWGFDSLASPCRDYTVSGSPVTDHPTYDDNQHDSGVSNQPWLPFATGGPVRSTPTVGADGTIYVGSDDGHLYAINPGDGTQKWKYPASGSIGAVRSQPAIGNGGVIYFGSDDGKLYAVSPAGTLINSFAIATDDAEPVHSPVIGAGGKVYVGSDNSKFYGFDSTLTTKEWEFTAAGPISYGRPARNPALGPEGIIYLSHRSGVNGRVYALNPVQRELDPTGAGFVDGANEEWEFNIIDGNDSMPGIDPVTGTIYSDSFGNKIVAITPAGSQDWEFVFGFDFDSTPVVGVDGTVYFGADDNNLYAINPEDRNNGEIFPTLREWTFATGGAVDNTPAIAPDGTILVVSRDSTLYAVNPDGTEKWNFPISANVGLPNSSPTVGNQGVVYVGSFGDNQLYALNDFATPRNFRDRVVTSVLDGSDVKVAGQIVTVIDALNWLNGDGTNIPWAVRLEVLRGQTQNADLNYEYTLRFWIRQCNSVACDNILGTFFQDTRVEYAPTPDLIQTIELTDAENSAFNRFLFGFTGATGSTTTQNAVIANFLLSFIRPNDPLAGP